MSKTIMGIKLGHRVETAKEVQGILTKYGCYIQTRVGVHQATKDTCSPFGIILLDILENSDEQVKAMEEELANIADVEIKKMVF